MAETILLGALALLAFLHIVAPFALRRVFRFSAPKQHQLLTTREIGPELESNLAEIAPTLKNLGFEHLGCYDFGELSSPARTFVALFSHPNTNDFASFVMFGDSRFGDGYLEFSTGFASGLRLDTNNNSVLPLTPDPQNVRVFRFSEMHDPRDLYRLHRKLIEKHSAGAWAKPEAKGQEISRWVRTMENYGPRHVALGYMKPARESGCYKLTWKGAALMAWKGMFPSTVVRQVLHRFAMNAELRSLEVRGVTTLQKA